MVISLYGIATIFSVWFITLLLLWFLFPKQEGISETLYKKQRVHVITLLSIGFLVGTLLGTILDFYGITLTAL